MVKISGLSRSGSRVSWAPVGLMEDSGLVLSVVSLSVVVMFCDCFDKAFDEWLDETLVDLDVVCFCRNTLVWPAWFAAAILDTFRAWSVRFSAEMLDRLLACAVRFGSAMLGSLLTNDAFLKSCSVVRLKVPGKVPGKVPVKLPVKLPLKSSKATVLW